MNIQYFFSKISIPRSLRQQLIDNTRLYGQVLAYSLMLSNLTFIPYIHANPAGGNIVGGVGHIHNSALNTVIHQNSSSLAIDWNSFNVGVDERVQFLQPDASSISLNRILDNSG